MKLTLSVHFRLRLHQKKYPSKAIADKAAAIRCHVTINGQTEVAFSTGYQIEPSGWNQATEQIIEAGPKATYQAAVNQLLNDMRGELFELFVLLKREGGEINARTLIVHYQRHQNPLPKVLVLFEEYLTTMKARIGIRGNQAVEPRTYAKWLDAKKNLAGFIQFKFGRQDLELGEVKIKHAKEFVAYMTSRINNQGDNITNEHAYRTYRCWFTVMKYAAEKELIAHNPFQNCDLKRGQIRHQKIFLLPKDLQLIATAEGLTKTERGIVDCFMVMALTGFTHGDYEEFARQPRRYIFQDDDGYRYIRKRRFKFRNNPEAKVPFIPLLPELDKILEKWQDKLPVFANRIVNEKIRAIAHRLGIANWEKITSYAARKSNGMMWYNMDGVDPKVVQEIMGHESFTTTEEHYVQVLSETVKRQTWGVVMNKAAEAGSHNRPAGE